MVVRATRQQPHDPTPDGAIVGEQEQRAEQREQQRRQPVRDDADVRRRPADDVGRVVAQRRSEVGRVAARGGFVDLQRPVDEPVPRALLGQRQLSGELAAGVVDLRHDERDQPRSRTDTDEERDDRGCRAPHAAPHQPRHDRSEERREHHPGDEGDGDDAETRDAPEEREHPDGDGEQAHRPPRGHPHAVRHGLTRRHHLLLFHGPRVSRGGAGATQRHTGERFGPHEGRPGVRPELFDLGVQARRRVARAC